MIVRCGITGTGTRADPFRPAVVDHLPPGTGWALVHDHWDGGRQTTEFTVEIHDEVDLATIPAGVAVAIEGV